jgi:hypothetical protein
MIEGVRKEVNSTLLKKTENFIREKGSRIFNQSPIWWNYMTKSEPILNGTDRPAAAR